MIEVREVKNKILDAVLGQPPIFVVTVSQCLESKTDRIPVRYHQRVTASGVGLDSHIVKRF